MKQTISRLIKIFLTTLGCLGAAGEISLAQVTSDDTVNTQVEQDDGVAEITGGETRGDNLFHSFEDFSVPTDNEAFFNNAESIGNIFSRVTGGNASDIDGAIRANGGANLFLINPNGIIFGENASLNIGGSFYGSTAESIIFPEGEFSATAPESESVLTVKVPIGLGLGSTPGNITNNSVANDGNGLEVAAGENITLVGGDINFEGGQVTASGGTVNLGGLSAAGEVIFNEDNSLSFPNNIARGDVSFSNAAGVTVAGEGGGNINVDAGNLRLVGGDSGASGFEAGITPDSTVTDAQAGNITIDATNDIAVNNSLIVNGVDSEAIGNAGDISITTDSMSISNNSLIITATEGQGDAGSVNITADDTISIDGQNSNSEFPSSIVSGVGLEATGDSGGVNITTGSLSLANGGQIDSSTTGEGNAGSVDITAEETISIDGQEREFPSGIFSSVDSEGVGDAGEIDITTGSLSLTNGGRIDNSTEGQGDAGSLKILSDEAISVDGESSNTSPSSLTSRVAQQALGNAGDVSITADSLSLTNGGEVNASTFGRGNAGSVEITANDTISIDGERSDGNPGAIGSTVQAGAVGDAKDISITTNSLSLTNGGQLSASTFSQGNAGSVKVVADGLVSIDGETSDGLSSSVNSSVASQASGDGGNVDITTDSLSLTDGGEVDASTFGQGNAGSVKVVADGLVSIDGETSNGFSSSANSRVAPEASGSGGNVNITAGSLSLTDGGEVSANTVGQGNAGSVEIITNDNISIDGERADGFPSSANSSVAPKASGDGGDVSITTGSLSLTNGGAIAANTFGQGNAGSVEIIANDNISIDGERADGSFSLISSLVAPDVVGNAGDINITTDSLSLTNGGRIDNSTFGQGNAGLIDIVANDNISLDGESSNSSPSSIGSTFQPGAVGKAGDVSITTDSLSLTNGGQVSTSTFGQGNAGSIEIVANDSISIDGEKSDNSPSSVNNGVAPEALGNAGGIDITTNSLNITNGGEVTASTKGEGNAGSVDITANDNISIDGEKSDGIPSSITSLVNPSASGDAGGVNITTGDLSLSEEGLVSVSNEGEGNAGQLAVTADSLSLSNDAEISALTTSGQGGNINLQIAEDLTLENNSSISARASNDADGGNLTIDSQFIIATPNQNNDLVANAERGTGGNIDIASSGVFGLKERNSTPDNNTNDIDASSELGVDGTVNLNTNYDFQNSFELVQPEFDVAKRALEGSCFAQRNARQGSFVYGGTGGLPVSPDLMVPEEESYSSRLSRVKPNLPSPNPLETNSVPEEPELPEGSEINSLPEVPQWQIGDPIVEATDMIRTADGRTLWINRHVHPELLACRKP